MYGIFIYIWLRLMVHVLVGEYSIHLGNGLPRRMKEWSVVLLPFPRSCIERLIGWKNIYLVDMIDIDLIIINQSQKLLER